MKNLCRMTILAALLASLPVFVHAKGGMQPRPNKDFRELIVKGERPEIASCLVAAIDYARRSATYGAIRWDDEASDQAVMRETEADGRLTRHVRLTAQMRERKPVLFGGRWLSVDIACEQQEDGVVRIAVTATAP